MSLTDRQTRPNARAFPLFHIFVCALISIFLNTVPAHSQEGMLCAACHKGKNEGVSVHPVTLSKGCVACHTKPHSAKGKPMKFLFATGMDLCFGCHDKSKFTRPVVHPPVARNCETCHAVHVSENPRLLVTKMPDLCFGCHDKTKFTDKSVHPPVVQGKCTGCHDPHSSTSGKLLLAASPDLCFRCHDKGKFSGKAAVHSPVRDGLCTSCHAPHVSSADKLLLSPAPDLCYGCHDGKRYTGKKTVHAPVGQGMCTSCHSPHQSDTAKLLVARTPDLCFNCHDKEMFSQATQHPPVAQGACMACHSPHTTKRKYLMPKSVNKTCLKCHPNISKQPHAVNVGRRGHPLSRNKRLPDGKRLILNCASCHNPHSSPWPRLFKQPREALCSSCHVSK